MRAFRYSDGGKFQLNAEVATSENDGSILAFFGGCNSTLIPHVNLDSDEQLLLSLLLLLLFEDHDNLL